MKDNTYRVTVIELDTGRVWEDFVMGQCADDARKSALIEPIEEVAKDRGDLWSYTV